MTEPLVIEIAALVNGEPVTLRMHIEAQGGVDPDPDPDPFVVAAFHPQESTGDPLVRPTVLFNRAVAQASAAGIELHDGAGSVPALVVVNAQGVMLIPDRPLTPRGYTLTVPNTVTDLAGVPLETAMSFSFTVTGVNPPDPDPEPDVVEALIESMTVPHEGPLDGVPLHYDWSQRPRMGLGNDARGGRAANGWGQVYTSGGMMPPNTQVEVADMRSAVLLRSTGKWKVLQATRPSAGELQFEGAYFKADFAGNTSKPGVSSTPQGSMVAQPHPGWNFHFWPKGRASIDPGDIAAMCTWYNARVVRIDPGGPDNVDAASVVAGAGGDYYSDLTNPPPPKGDWSIGRHLKLGREWRTLICHTMTAEQIATNPPPVELADGTVVTPDPDPPPVTPPGALKVMAMGDSITLGQAELASGFKAMGQMLAAAGFPVEFVGSEQAVVAHEGHGGWCADDTGGRCVHTSGFDAGGMAQNARAWVTAAQPDIVILNAGTNDRYVTSPATDSQIAGYVGTVIDEIHAARPDTLVMVTGLKSWGEVATGASDNRTLNPLLQAACALRADAGRNVRYFDAYRLVTSPGDFTGQWSVHPSPQGVAKMAQATAEALAAVLRGS